MPCLAWVWSWPFYVCLALLKTNWVKLSSIESTSVLLSSYLRWLKSNWLHFSLNLTNYFVVIDLINIIYLNFKIWASQRSSMLRLRLPNAINVSQRIHLSSLWEIEVDRLNFMMVERNSVLVEKPKQRHKFTSTLYSHQIHSTLHNSTNSPGAPSSHSYISATLMSFSSKFKYFFRLENVINR